MIVVELGWVVFQHRMMPTTQWNNVSSVFDQKSERWHAKSSDVAVSGDDCPLDSYVATKIHAGVCFVDLGCGNGKALTKIATSWNDGIAILLDLSALMLNKAAIAVATTEGIRKVLVRANADRTPLPSSFADFVILRQVLQHVPRPGAVIREAARLVRPNGEILVQVPGPSYLSAWDPFTGHQSDAMGRFSATELHELFADAGLQASVSAHTFDFTFYDVPGALQFFAEVSVIDKLVGYHHNASEILRALLAQRMVRGLLRSDGAKRIVVQGEYLFGKGTK